MNIENLEAVFAPLAAILWGASWQSGLAVLLIWIVCRLIPRLAAHVRCWLWRLALLKFLLALAAPIPSLRLPLLPAPPPAVIPVSAVPETLPAPSPPLPFHPQSAAPARLEPIPVPASPTTTPSLASLPSLSLLSSLSLCLVCLWLVGVACGTGRLLQLALRSRAWLRTGCTEVTAATATNADAALLADHAYLAKRLGLRSLPTLCIAPDIALPMVVGFRRPRVVLPPPEQMAAFGDGARRLMLAHELAHLQRRDLWWNWLGTAVRLLFFFHPLVYIARREEEIAREMACDALALQAAGAPTAEYGALLLSIAARGRTVGSSPVTVLGISGTAGAFKQRLRALQNRAPLTRREQTVAVIGILTAALLGLIPWRVVAQRPLAATPTTTFATTPDTGDMAQSVLEGRVVGTDRKPVTGAQVTQYRWMTRKPEKLASVITGADGTFRLPWTGRRSGSDLLVTAEGKGLFVFSPKWDREGQEDRETAKSVSVLVTLRPAVTLRASIRDRKGRPVANLPVEVLWFGTSPYRSVRLADVHPSGIPTHTDANGNLIIPGLAPGGYLFLETPDPRFAHTWFTGKVYITGASPDQPATVTLPPASRAEGRVTFGPDGKPAAGMRVIAQETTAGTDRAAQAGTVVPQPATTDAQGRYRFDRLRPGSYRFWVLIEGQEQRRKWAAPVLRYVPISADRPRKGLDFVLSPVVLVRGRVTDAATGRPLAGIHVTRGNETEATRYLYTTETRPDGQYTLPVAPGTAIIQLGDSPRATARLSAPLGSGVYRRTLVVKTGREYNADFRVPARFNPTGVAPITGRVLGPDGRPAAGAEVLLLRHATGLPDEDRRVVRTDSEGRFRAESLPASWVSAFCEVRARQGDLVSQRARVRVERTVTSSQTLTLVRGLGAAISGRVTDGAGKALTGASVRLCAWSSDADLTEETRTDAQGRYRFGPLWPDLRYNIETMPAGYVGRAISIGDSNSFKPGERRTDRNLVLSKASQTLSGQLVTPAGRPVSKAILSLSAGDGDFHSALPDASGHFRFPQVGNGALTLTVQPDWGADGPSSASFRQTVRAAQSPLRVVVR